MSSADSSELRRAGNGPVDFCEENKRLLNQFAETVTALSVLHEQQFVAPSRPRLGRAARRRHPAQQGEDVTPLDLERARPRKVRQR